MFSYFKNKYYRNIEMVSYWKTKDSVKAKVTRAPEGHYVMHMEGEKYPFPGYPRGSLLHGTKEGEYGKLSVLKHNIKNQIFNDIWYKTHDNVTYEHVINHIYEVANPNIYQILESMRYDMVPYEKMVPPVKEFYRAMTEIERSYESKTASRNVRMWKDILSFIFQEDDAYRFRFQWLVKVFNPSSLWFKVMRKDPVEELMKAFDLLEHAEVIGDMRERVRLWKYGLNFLLTYPEFKDVFVKLCQEMDWNKLKLTKADKYFLRGKYFKCDFPEYDY